MAETVVGACWIRGLHLSSSSSDPQTQFVAVGSSDTFHETFIVKIVNPDTNAEVSKGIVGEVWLAGTSIAAGYFGKPKLTAEVFHATLSSGNECEALSYLRTGDLGFIDEDGKLFICGRIKDLIIVNGVNYYPQDMERVVEEASNAVRPGCVAAFPLDDAGKGGEVGIIFEIRNASVSVVKEATEEIYLRVLQETGLKPALVIAIKERTIPKTTSGKIRRKESRFQLLSGALNVVFKRGTPQDNCAFPPNEAQAPHFLHDYQTLDDREHQAGADGGSSLATLKDSEKVEKEVSDLLGGPSAKTDSGRTEHQEISPDQDCEFVYKKILIQFFGESFSWDSSWEELGLSSMSSIELHQALGSGLSRNLPDDIFEQYHSPRCLQKYILTAPTGNIQIELQPLPEGPALSWKMISLVQLLGAGLLLLFFGTSAIPAYAAYWLSGHLQPSFTTYVVSPLVIPAWMISYSFLVVVAKWILIGRYQEQVVKLPSGSYISWWFVDRAMHYWELFIGFLVNDTPVIRFYYVLLGAKIHKTAQINGFIREFDLVEIGEHAVLEHNIRCQMFSTRAKGSKNGVFSIRFRSICIEKEATVKGVLCPGVFVGKGAAVSNRTVVPEGGKVPAGSTVVGNPSVVAGQANKASFHSFGSLKCLWLVVELYAHLGFLLAAQSVIKAIALPTWRYSQLLNFVLLLLLIQVFSLTISIVLKWVLIGKRHPGNVQPSLWCSFKDWAADYHFRLSTILLFSFWSNSRAWNCILMLYGMDIDFWSKVGAVSFPPSQIDLVSIRNSFVSKVAFQVESDGAYHKTVVKDSSIGYDALIGPGVQIVQTIIPPIKYIQRDVIGNRSSSHLSGSHKMQIIMSSLLVEVFYLCFWALLFASILPVYEIAMSAADMHDKYYFPFGILLCLVQLLSSIVVLLVIELATYGMSSKRDQPWCTPLYAVYITANWALQTWSLLPLLWGTSWFNAVIRILGAKFTGRGDGRVLFFGEFYDPPYLNFVNDVIVDGGNFLGHYMTFSDIKLGESKATGVVNANSFLSCGSSDGLDDTNESSHFFVRVSDGGRSSMMLTDSSSRDGNRTKNSQLKKKNSNGGGSGGGLPLIDATQRSLTDRLDLSSSAQESGIANDFDV